MEDEKIESALMRCSGGEGGVQVIYRDFCSLSRIILLHRLRFHSISKSGPSFLSVPSLLLPLFQLLQLIGRISLAVLALVLAVPLLLLPLLHLQVHQQGRRRTFSVSPENLLNTRLNRRWWYRNDMKAKSRTVD